MAIRATHKTLTFLLGMVALTPSHLAPRPFDLLACNRGVSSAQLREGPMHKSLTVGSILFLFAATIAVGLFLAPGAEGRSFEGVEPANTVQPLVMAALMFCGVVFGAIYAELQAENSNAALAFRRAFTHPTLYRALLVAPIVFAGVYAFAKSTSDPIVIGIFAFQNGFFCEAVFRKSGDPTVSTKT